MKNKVFLLIIIAFFAINLFSEDIMPLEIGNSWTYEYSAGPSFEGEFYMEVTEKVEVFGEEVYKLDFEGALFDGEYWQLLKNIEDGLYFYGHTFHGELETPDLWIEADAEVGQTWQTQGQGGEVEWEVISISEEITVPAGTFECIYVQGKTDGSSSVVEHWWAVGVGEIKAYMEAANLVWELTAYDVK